MNLTPEQLAQLRDLLRVVCWIRDIQLSESPDTFDLRDIFADFNRAFGLHQLQAARKLYSHVDEFLKAHNLPAAIWRME